MGLYWYAPFDFCQKVMVMAVMVISTSREGTAGGSVVGIARTKGGEAGYRIRFGAYGGTHMAP
jgi:hypothetical protein